MANVQIDNLASEVMKGLMEYKDLVTSDMKVAVRKAGRSVKKDIQANAPKKTGAYSKSWKVSKERYPSECSKENRCLLEKLDGKDHERDL